jgi:alpha-L-fucosidase
MKKTSPAIISATLGFMLFAANRGQALDLPITPGPFAGTMDSLTNYACPEWFRDAKFGIWAHWGPQAVPEQGDWYARRCMNRVRLIISTI